MGSQTGKNRDSPQGTVAIRTGDYDRFVKPVLITWRELQRWLQPRYEELQRSA